MKQLIITISIVVLLINCKDSILESEVSYNYFPLEVGNKWNFISYFNDYGVIDYTSAGEPWNISYEVIGKKEINSKNYFLVQQFNKNYNSYDTVYYRFDYDKLYRLNQNRSTRVYSGGLLAKFSTAVGDTFHCRMFNQDYIGLVLQKENGIIKIHYYIPGWFDEESEITFVKDIGILEDYSTDWKLGKKLVEYKLK